MGGMVIASRVKHHAQSHSHSTFLTYMRTSKSRQQSRAHKPCRPLSPPPSPTLYEHTFFLFKPDLCFPASIYVDPSED